MMTLDDLRKPKRPILFDGGFGACLQHRGLEPGKAPETWNLSRPADVRRLHVEFVGAGSNVIETNTFGANARRFHAGEVTDSLESSVRAAARLAFEAADGRVLVAGSAGPLGELIEPFGELSVAEARRAFLEQYGLLKANGVRVLLIETMMSLDEALVALEAAKTTGFDLVGVSMTYDPTPHGPRTAFGVAPAVASRELGRAGADIVGSNCGSGFDTMRVVAQEYLANADVPVLLQPNAGIPILGARGPVYPESPVKFGDFLGELSQMGVPLLGGCCGAEPEHIREANRALSAR